MSANPHRRRLLGLFAAAPLAAASGGQPAATATGLLRRLSPGAAMDFSRERFAGLGRLAERLEELPAPPDGDVLERLALDLDGRTAPHFHDRLFEAKAVPHAVLAQQAAESRAIAALALAYPPEIAAYRSFGAPMRRRLYAELLTRESERLSAAAEPPSTPPASPGPDA